MKRRLFALLAGLALIAASPAPAADLDRLRGMVEPVVAKKPFRIGVTLVHLNDDFWKGIAYGIADEAKLSGAKVVQISVAGGYGNVPQQFAQLETLRSLGVDAVVVGTAAFDGYNAILKSLKAGGIKVVAAGIPVNSAAVDFGVTMNDTAIGAALADAVCKAKGDKPATALVIPGPAGAEWARLRHVGFDERAKSCAGLSLVEGAVGGALGLEHGLAEASDMLIKHPDAGFIYTPEISLGLGAAQAVRQSGGQAKIVSSSVVRESIPLVKDGRILADGSEPGILIGRLIVQYLIRQQDGLPTPNLAPGSPYPTVIVPTELITPANADSYPFDLYEIPPKDWSIQAFQ
jgi:ABC-type sugar transport system substrate-binding protein